MTGAHLKIILFQPDYAGYSGKILPKNEPKFMEKRGAVGFKTGS